MRESVGGQSLDETIALASRGFAAPLDQVAALMGELLEVATKVSEEGELASLSHASSAHGNAEGGVYLRRGDHIGAMVHIHIGAMRAGEARIRVRPLSRLQGIAQWVLLGAGLVLGLGASLLVPGDLGALRFVFGLTLGLALGVGGLFAFIRSGIGTSEESREVSERLAEAVGHWLESR